MKRQQPKGMGVATPGSGEEFLEARMCGPFLFQVPGNLHFVLSLNQPESLIPLEHTAPAFKPEVRDYENA